MVTTGERERRNATNLSVRTGEANTICSFALGSWRCHDESPRVNASPVPARIGIVIGGFVAALAGAWIAILVRQYFTSGPDALATSGMHAFGDFVLGVAVFAALALVPAALGLYWLRPVDKFWSAFAWSALLYALTGPLAVVASMSIENSTGGWTLLLSVTRIGLMPLSAMAFLMCAILAPQKRERWLLVVSAIVDAAVVAGLVLVKFVLPRLAGT